MLEARIGAWWDTNKIGLSLFDAETLGRCLKRSDGWIFGPRERYERRGDVDNVVFPCGVTLAPDGDTLRLYYSAADSCIALATGGLRAVLNWLHQQ